MRRVLSSGFAMLLACAAAEPQPVPPSTKVIPGARDGPTPANATATVSSAANTSESTADLDPCAAASTTLAMGSCAKNDRQRLEAEIQTVIGRLTNSLSAHGVAEAAALLNASQNDWQTYRTSQCQLFEKLSEGGSLARIDVAFCLRDLAKARLSDLQSVERSIVE